jgi:glycolate oxidase FAD binding subunit
VLSTNDSGALRLRFGSLRDLVIGATVALADGTVASSGGKVVRNVAGYDLPKLVTGAFGTLGVITRAIFRLHPLPKETRTISCTTVDAAEAQRLVLAIQNSKLAHSALQICCGAETQPRVDVLFEGTEAGLSAQSAQLKLMGSEAMQDDATGEVWNRRQEIFLRTESAGDNFAVAKFATLPAEIVETVEMIAKIAASGLRCGVVAQATGIGWLRIDGAVAEIATAVRGLREWLEARGGSLAITRWPARMAELEAWGNSGDALGLMQAVKRQFDPQGTLNPGRFVGGI